MCYYSVWKAEELKVALLPTLEKLFCQEPESLPFRNAVDPVLLQIPVSCKYCLTQIPITLIYLTLLSSALKQNAFIFFVTSQCLCKHFLFLK